MTKTEKEYFIKRIKENRDNQYVFFDKFRINLYKKLCNYQSPNVYKIERKSNDS